MSLCWQHLARAGDVMHNMIGSWDVSSKVDEKMVCFAELVGCHATVLACPERRSLALLQPGAGRAGRHTRTGQCDCYTYRWQ